MIGRMERPPQTVSLAPNRQYLLAMLRVILFTAFSAIFAFLLLHRFLPLPIPQPRATAYLRYP
jgi:hypothetical protein